MKLGILGTGNIVKSVMEMIHKLNLESISILGRKEHEEAARNLCEEFGLNGYYLDYDKMLHSDADAIYIALPNHLHAPFAKKALMANKHLVIEKPITANAEELKELIQIAQERELIMLEAMNIHYLPAFQSLKSNLHQAGQIRIVSLNFSQYSSRYDAFQAGNILPAFDPDKAGGALMDLNVYNLHALTGLFGKPQSICYKANIQKGIDTSGMAALDYGAFQAAAIGAKDCIAPNVCTIQGEKGCFILPKQVSLLDSYEFVSNNGQVAKYEIKSPEHRLYYEFKAFKEIIEENNWTKAEYYLNISQTVSKLLDEARIQAGIKIKNFAG